CANTVVSSHRCCRPSFWSRFFYNDTATTEIYTLSLHDALPISSQWANCLLTDGRSTAQAALGCACCSSITCISSLYLAIRSRRSDRKSTRLNSSHVKISYAVFCLKKKKKKKSTYH